jgi:glycosyltransferase involved in cell wall biosynthesis
MTGSGRASVSVVICTPDDKRWPYLTAAVASVQHQTAAPCEIIVVVDHNPCLLDRVKSEFQGAIGLANAEARGLSGARNTGIAVARGDFIAFLDDDATAAPDWLDYLTRACDSMAVLGAGGRVVPRWATSRPAWFPEEFYWVLGCSYRGLPETRAPVRNLFGGCCLIRREVFAQVGTFRHQLGRGRQRALGCEETELCIRAQQYWPDRKWLYEPRASIWHHVPAERASWRYFRTRCYGEGLSKAIMTGLVGSTAGLSAERRHVFRALPAGILRGLAAAVRQGEWAGVQQAGAMIAGLATAVAGYTHGSLVRLGDKWHRQAPTAGNPSPSRGWLSPRTTASPRETTTAARREVTSSK